MTICTGGQHARAWGELRLVMAAMACSRDAADYTAPPGSSPWQWQWQRLWHWHIAMTARIMMAIEIVAISNSTSFGCQGAPYRSRYKQMLVAKIDRVSHIKAFGEAQPW